ncbi:MAG: hypothetical protein H0U84_08680, partial [Thermoleophilaceae bacterium]|nr:hypothetical protein [Thermoleophilaceae bacterium]
MLVTAVRQILLVLAVALIAFGALFAVARAGQEPPPEPVAVSQPDMPTPEDVAVDGLAGAD